MVFSAPEITTVSKPKRKPARAEVRDQKKMRPFIVVRGGAYHRINTSRGDTTTRGVSNEVQPLVSDQGEAFSPPITNATVHRNHVGVTHLLQIVGSQGGPESPSAVKDHLRVQLRNATFDVTLDDSLAEMDSAWKMICGELAFLSHVDEQEFVTAVHPLLDSIDIGLANAASCVVNDFQETWRMLVGHGSSFSRGRTHDNGIKLGLTAWNCPLSSSMFP